MNKGRAGEDRGSKETDGCPLIDRAIVREVEWKACEVNNFDEA
jgi:hypothetical protein